MTDLLDRIPPHSDEAERAVLGAMMMDADALGVAVKHLEADAFFHPAHRILFDFLLRHAERDEPIDGVLLEQALKSAGRLEEVGGRQALVDIYNSVASAANAEHYARIVQEKSRCRRLVAMADEMQRAVFAPDGEADKIIEQAEDGLMKLRRGTRREAEPISAIIAHLMARLRLAKPLMRGLKTGWYELDAITGGLHAGELIVLASRPGIGKSSFATNLAQNVATSGGRVGLFSLEMSSDEIVLRLLSGHSGIPLWTLRKEAIGAVSRDRLEKSASDLSKTGIFIVDAPGLRLMDLRFRARDLVRQHKVALIIVDYLQLVQGIRAKGDGRVQEVGSISMGLKHLAREAHVPVLAVAALRRPHPGSTGGRPTMEQLRESGSLEQDADVVLLLHREAKEPARAELIVAKHRNGPPGIVPLVWMAERVRFESAAASVREPGAQEDNSPF